MQESRCLCAFLLLLVAVVATATDSPETSCFETETAQQDFAESVKKCKEELGYPAGPPKRFNLVRMMKMGKCVLGKKDALKADGMPDKAKTKELITPYIKPEYRTVILQTYETCLPEVINGDAMKTATGCIMMEYKNWGCVPSPGFKMPAFPGA